MPTFDDHRTAAKDELKKLAQLEKKKRSLDKPGSWERFKAFFQGGHKQATAQMNGKINNLEQQITQNTAPNFLAQYRQFEKDVDVRVQKEVSRIRGEKAAELNDTLATLGVGGDIKEKPKTPKVDDLDPNRLRFQPVSEALQRPGVSKLMHNFSQKTGCGENMNFHDAIESLKADAKDSNVSLATLKQKARAIYDEYVPTEAPQLVTLDNHQVQGELSDAMEDLDNLSREDLGALFDRAKNEVIGMLEGTYQRLVNSEEGGKAIDKLDRGVSPPKVRQVAGVKGPTVGGTTNSKSLHTS